MPDGSTGDWSAERQEWLDAFESLLRERGAEGAREVLTELEESLALTSGAPVRRTLNSAYRNTIDVLDQGEYYSLERRGYGASGLRQRLGRGRPHSDLPVGRNNDGGGFQPFLSGGQC